MSLLRFRNLTAVGILSCGGYYYNQSKKLEGLYANVPVSDMASMTVGALLKDYNIDAQKNLYTPYHDCYTARIPLSEIKTDETKKNADGLLQLYQDAFFKQALMRYEGSLLSKFTGKNDGEGVGDAKAGGALRILSKKRDNVDVSPKETKDLIKHSAFDVPVKSFNWFSYLKWISKPSSASIVMDWTMSDGAVGFFDKLSTFGYPCGLYLLSGDIKTESTQTGGVQELHVATTKDDAIFTYATTHFYDPKDNKVIPKWVQKVHDTYARMLLDGAISGLKSIN
ncbi:hypothetical protein E3Q03_03062 [Wallemia mellicola]|uniref:Lipoprotein n=1 Tax=Wallemia mellicola TaxID=1708541 RepID=A0AB74KAV6_9BASI|nr:hypothetical protein E3Q03_03062 [Wallemia mellicola]